MKIAPLKVSDPWFGRIMNDAQVPADSLSSVPIESTVEMELVELLHGAAEGNYRPYLHLRGELTEVRPAVELPYGVSELALRRGAGLTVDAFYDFNQQQLAELVGKGYFTEAFKVPEGMSGIPWKLPGKADFLVVAPALSDEPPVVFMNVREQNSLELDEANSGYELTEYFPDYSAENQPTPEAGVDEPVRSGPALDVFGGVDFEEHKQVDLPAQQPRGEDLDLRSIVPDGVFSRLVSEIQAQQPTEAAPVAKDEPGVEQVVPGSAWDVYLSRVSPGVEHVLSGAHVAEAEAEDAEAEKDSTPQDAEVEAGALEADAAVVAEADGAAAALVPEGFLDLTSPDAEVEVASLSAPLESVADAHRRAVERQAARLRAELEVDQTPSADDEAQPVL